MNVDLVSYSHAQVRVWVHLSLKIKYCHEVFDIKEFRESCKETIIWIFQEYNIQHDTIGFDSNHLHTIIDLGLRSVPEIVKIIKGVSGKKLLNQFPEIKKKYFWGSGLWSGTKYVYSIGRNKEDVRRYVAKQKYFNIPKEQTSILDF